MLENGSGLKELEYVNKLIFVREYELAFDLLVNLLDQVKKENSSLIHLRAIQLASKLGKTQELLKFYQSDDCIAKLSSNMCRVCQELIKQQASLSPTKDQVDSFRKLIDDDEQSPLGYFGLASALVHEKNLIHAIYNFEQSIKLDANWYPSYFGLSQLYYQMDDEVKGDYYFYLYEKHAPYNLYGNFETHKNLCQEFMDLEEYHRAEIAITTLTDWWFENKGFCPPEIQIYESLLLEDIAIKRNDNEDAEIHRDRINLIIKHTIEDGNVNERTLYFIAKTLEQYSNFDQALHFYKSILRRNDVSGQIMQKIGNQFLTSAFKKYAAELYTDAYNHQPDNDEIRFFYLVSQLKLSKVDAEAYFVEKEKLKSLLSSQERNNVSLLSHLHSMNSMFEMDPDVLAILGEIYQNLGNLEKSKIYFKKMYDCDQKSIKSCLKYASFLLIENDIDQINIILDSITIDNSHSDYQDYLWIQARLLTMKNEFEQASVSFKKLLQHDPWDMSFLTHYVHCMSMKHQIAGDIEPDPSLEFLVRGEEKKINWKNFIKKTEEISQKHLYDLAYFRAKLSYLYSQGEASLLNYIVYFAVKYDAKIATNDLLKLLNTNFDHPQIYLALGKLFKEQWQHQTATMWLEQVLMQKNTSNEIKKETYIELADSYLCLNTNIEICSEYARIAMELEGKDHSDAVLKIFSRFYLKKGDPRQAKICIDQLKSDQDFESIYLRGLLQFRNGNKEKAKNLWKALISRPTKNLKDHYLKQDLLKFYYEDQEYFQAS